MKFGILVSLFTFVMSLAAHADEVTLVARPGEFIVKVKPNHLFIQTDAHQIGKSHFYWMKAPADKSFMSTKSLLSTLTHKNDIEYIEPNYIYHKTDAAPAKVVVNDTDFPETWNIQNKINKNADIHVVDLWREGIVGNQKTIVAIIDSGLDYHHPDLQKNLFTDKEGNHGWNFVNNTPDANDDDGHGTHCAGIIGAEANNHFGIAGINWNVSILPLKFLDAQGFGDTKNAILAIEYARKMGAKVINASWGGQPFSQALYDAIKAAGDDKILFVTSAGNKGTDNDKTPFYPGSYDLPNIISVAATDEKDQIAAGSNFGAKSVHISAPGENILSTYVQDGFETLSGTSMAAPHIAGVAALLLSKEPALTPIQIRERLMKSSDPVNPQGRVNAYNAIHKIFPARNSK